MLYTNAVITMRSLQETFTLESLSDWLCPDDPSRVAQSALEMGDVVKIHQLCHPLLFGLNHNIRMPFRHHGQEKGTTIPLVLYLGLKVKLMRALGLEAETPENLKEISKKTRKIVRQVMIDIYAYAANAPKDEVVDISKTLQSKVFHYITSDEDLSIHGAGCVVFKSESYKFAAHQVSGSSTPSITIQHYLCDWLIKRAGLHSATPYSYVNATLRQVAKQINRTIAVEPMPFWDQDSGFSRRVQNVLMLVAFSEAMYSSFDDVSLLNPERYRV